MNRYTLAIVLGALTFGVTQAQSAQPPSGVIPDPLPPPARQSAPQPRDPHYCYLADKAYSQGAAAEGLVCVNESMTSREDDMRWETPPTQKK